MCLYLHNWTSYYTGDGFVKKGNMPVGLQGLQCGLIAWDSDYKVKSL